MPRIHVVTSEKNLTELTAVLMPGRTAAATREAAVAAIRAANPGIDLERLHPGAVVVVPVVEGVKPPPEEPVAVAADDLTQRVREGLDALVAAADQAEAVRVEEKKAAQELLGSAAVKRAAEGLPELAANIDSVRATFKQDDGTSRKALVAMKESREVWDADLESLRALL